MWKKTSWKVIYKTERMKQRVGFRIIGLPGLLLLFLIVLCTSFINTPHNEQILSYAVNPNVQDLKLYWKNEQGEILRNFNNLKNFVEHKHQKLMFAMNGGMYTKDNSPQGLYIEDRRTLIPLDTSKGAGKLNYATQSGPMLLIDGAIHPAFKMGSENLNIRNGVDILPDNTLLFAMSKTEINFYDFAQYFKSKGCKNALYLNSFVSRVYLPGQNWIQMDGVFGVMIGVTEQNKK